MTKQMKQRSPLIFQSDELVTIRDGEIPILYLGTGAKGYLASRVAMAINCLRSGCPAVQFMWVGIDGIDIGKVVADMLNDSRVGKKEDFLLSYAKSIHTERLIVYREMVESA